MKKVILTALATLTLASQAQAGYYAPNGCWQVVMDNGGDTILCLDHIGEEGFVAPKVFVGVFIPYQADKINQCFAVDTRVKSMLEYAFVRDGKETLRFKFKNREFTSARISIIKRDGTYAEGDASRYQDGVTDDKMLQMNSDICK